jgi:hypothetical protein
VGVEEFEDIHHLNGQQIKQLGYFVWNRYQGGMLRLCIGKPGEAWPRVPQKIGVPKSPFPLENLREEMGKIQVIRSG